MLKKIFYVLGGLIILIIAAAIVIPIIFKDDIRAAIKEEIEKNVNATVIFNEDLVDVTLFRNFPNLTVSLNEFGVFNKEPFDGQLLLAVKKLEVVVNLKSVLFDHQMRVKGILLDEPQINIKVLADGTANYDIAMPSEDTVATEETPEETSTGEDNMTFGIDHWEIRNARITYDDESIPVTAKLLGLTHSGSGDFTLSVFDLKTKTHIDTLAVTFDGVNYLNNRTFDADLTLNLDLDQSKYTFKENVIKLNDFALAFDGWLAMPDDGMDMDITYSSTDNSFKSLLSLVPAVYTSDFNDIKTSGNLSFAGAVKGRYTDTSMPAFNLALAVNNAMFQYPDLPSSVRNINIDLRVDNADGNIDNTVVDLRKLHLDFGNNPVDAKLLVRNLVTYPIDADAKATLDLSELSTMFPMEGMEMKGKFSFDLKAKGVYDSIKNIIPAIDLQMAMSDGYVKSADFPIPLENMNLQASVSNPTGKMAETLIKLDNFSMKMAEDEIKAKAVVQNLDDYAWDVNVNGGIDLGKMMEVFPQEGMSLVGKINANITTSGKMSDLDAERYDKLPTSGTISITGLKYTDNEYLPMGFVIDQAQASFDPKEIRLAQFKGNVGKTDLDLNGAFSNYMNYVLKDELIKGQLNFSSHYVDLNEFMTTDTTAVAETPEDTTSLEVVPIPGNIDFVLTASMNKILYDNLTLDNAKGRIIIRDGVLNLDGFGFNTLGGSLVMDGSYDTRDVSKPSFDFDLDINKMSIKQSFDAFNTVQTFAPAAKNMEGDYSTKFKISGDLGQDMMPVMNSVSGSGLIKLTDAALKNSKVISSVTALTKLKDSDNVSLNDLTLSVKIENGRLSVKPFDVKLGNYKTTIAGSTGLEGDLDYVMDMDVPAGAVGSQVNNTLASLTGSTPKNSDVIKLKIGLRGTYDDPKPALLASGTKDQVKQQVTQKAKEEATKEAKKLITKQLGNDTKTSQAVDSAAALLQDKEKAKAALAAKQKQIEDSVKAAVEARKKAVEDSLKKAAEAEAKKKLKNLFKKKGGN